MESSFLRWSKPSGRMTSGPKYATILESARVPGATTLRARTSASIIGIPEALGRAEIVDFPVGKNGESAMLRMNTKHRCATTTVVRVGYSYAATLCYDYNNTTSNLDVDAPTQIFSLFIHPQKYCCYRRTSTTRHGANTLWAAAAYQLKSTSDIRIHDAIPKPMRPADSMRHEKRSFWSIRAGVECGFTPNSGKFR